MNTTRKLRRIVDGVLLLDKAAGLTSNAALQKVKRLFNATKAGHTGTLDPLATGLLPICFGESTKFSGELLHADKSYRACFKLGITTDTGDAEGTVIARDPVVVTDEKIKVVLQKFQGEIQQIPPMFSALKRDGKAFYEYARQGIELERQPRLVTIYCITLIARTDDEIVVDVDCSKGTYIRTLAEDVGQMLGCGAHLGALRRTRIGGFSLDAAIELAVLEEVSMESRDSFLLPVDAFLAAFPRVDLPQESAKQICNGQQVVSISLGEKKMVRIYGEGRFLGVGCCHVDGRLVPERLVAVKTS